MIWYNLNYCCHRYVRGVTDRHVHLFVIVRVAVVHSRVSRSGPSSGSGPASASSSLSSASHPTILRKKRFSYWRSARSLIQSSDLIHVNNLLIQLSEARASERENSRNLVAGVEAFRAQLANGNIKIVVRGNNDDVVNALEGMGCKYLFEPS